MSITILEAARAAYRNRDMESAYRTLDRLFGNYTESLGDRDAFREAMLLLGDLTHHFGNKELAEKVAAAGQLPDDVQHLFDAAYGLYEEGQYRPSVTLLRRANQLVPGNGDIVSELVASLEVLRFYPEAQQIIEDSGLCPDDPLATYLSGFTSVMTGDLTRARTRLAQTPTAFPLRMALEGMLARADALLKNGVALGECSLTAWQAVVSCTLLLHESPDGYEDAMRGRYALLGDGPALMLQGLQRLQPLLAAADFRPSRIVAAPGRASRVLATAAAQFFNLPFIDWAPREEREGLVVAWTLESAEDADFYEGISQHYPGSRLFVHASCWTDPFFMAPDVTTLLYQIVAEPWTEGSLRLDPATDRLVPSPTDPRDDAAIAQDILSAEPEPGHSPLDLVVEISDILHRLPEPYRPGLGRLSGHRARQRGGSPVLSNHF